MTRISHVTFPHPVAKSPKHEREQSFSSAGGWSIERDDGGDFHIYGNGCDFWTDGSTSWVPEPEPATLPITTTAPGEFVVDGSSLVGSVAKPPPGVKKGRRNA